MQYFFILVLLPQLLNARNRIVGSDWGSRPSGTMTAMGWIPWTESAHDWGKLTTEITRYLNGTDYTVPPSYETPDFRLPEPPWTSWSQSHYKEENRPFRLTPHARQLYNYNFGRYYYEYIYYLGCICTTVFKRLTPLAGCAILTTRHLLTTATSTELVLRRYRNRKTMENILGAWYDQTADKQNSSMYMTPARIHYHPGYTPVDRTNRSHPLPCMHDLSVWAATYRFISYSGAYVQVCNRAASGRFHYTASTPSPKELLLLVGYQYVWVINRKPAPWFKYMVKVRLQFNEMHVCPKVEWGWFHCIPGDKYAKLGFDQGGALHAAFEYKGYRTDGLIGLNAFSMRLRSLQIMNYFTVLDTHPNIGFYYAAYMGRLPYQFLDYRFFDTQFKAPILKPHFYIPWEYPDGYYHSGYDTYKYWN